MSFDHYPAAQAWWQRRPRCVCGLVLTRCPDWLHNAARSDPAAVVRDLPPLREESPGEWWRE